jgi:GNAT superfamily N-acetyltransferase
MALPLLRFTKSLLSAPAASSSDGVTLRTFEGRDVAVWLALREAAFRGLVAPGRPWTATDFEREFLAKPWWSPQRMWLATDAGGELIGAVTLGRSGRRPHDLPCVMWLMVVPQLRRRGLGRALLATLERAVWEAGERSVTLETHASWTDAVRLYEQCGYQRT